MQQKTSRTQSGFAVVELALIAVIILAVAGVGYWVYQQRSNSTSNGQDTAIQQVETKESVANEAANLAQQAVEDEAKTIQSSSESDAATAQSDSAVAEQIGDSSNATD